MRLLKLPDEVRADVASGTLSMGHARALLGLPTDAEQRRLAREIITRNLSVRETESMVKKIADDGPPRASSAPPKPADVHTRAAEENLRLALGTRVRIVRRGSRGRIEIDFNSEDELIRMFEQLTRSTEADRSPGFDATTGDNRAAARVAGSGAAGRGCDCGSRPAEKRVAAARGSGGAGPGSAQRTRTPPLRVGVRPGKGIKLGCL